MNSRFIHVEGMAEFLLFHGWIILQCVCVCVCVSACTRARAHPHTCVSHLLCSFIDRPLGCLHILAIMKNASVEMGIKRSLQDSDLISTGEISRSRTAGSYGSSIFNFFGITILFSIVSLPIHIPTNSAQVFVFLYILANTCYFVSFWWQLF